MAARRHFDQDRPDEHGGQPGGARAFARLPPDRIRREPARVDARQARDGQGDHEAGDGTLSAARYSLPPQRSDEHTSELQSLMRISYAVFCLKKNNNNLTTITKAAQRTSI